MSKRADAYLNEPIDEDSTHFLVDVRLARHVISRHAALDLRLAVESVDVLNVLYHCKLVSCVVLVNVGDRLLGLVHFGIEYTTRNLQNDKCSVSSAIGNETKHTDVARDKLAIALIGVTKFKD